jgi:hypothetical protein
MPFIKFSITPAQPKAAGSTGKMPKSSGAKTNICLRDELLRLMQKFFLTYEIGHTGEYIVPERLHGPT